MSFHQHQKINIFLKENHLENMFDFYIFIPKDDTPGCTIETNEKFNKLFKNNLSKFKKLDCEVYGISK